MKELQGIIIIYCDNQTTRVVEANLLFNKKKCTNRLKHDYLKELICLGVISVIEVRSSKNVTVPLTKCLKKELVKRTSAGMDLKSL